MAILEKDDVIEPLSRGKEGVQKFNRIREEAHSAQNNEQVIKSQHKLLDKEIRLGDDFEA